jgi:hypothetical protein
VAGLLLIGVLATVCHDCAVPLIDYFAAADDAVAATVMDVEGGPEAAGFETVYAKGIDPYVTLGTLESILTGRGYGEVTGDPRHCHALTDTEADAVVVSVTDALRDALAAMGDERRNGVAQEWAQTDELKHTDAGQLAQTLQLFGTLARHAVEGHARLYCWWAL